MGAAVNRSNAGPDCGGSGDWIYRPRRRPRRARQTTERRRFVAAAGPRLPRSSDPIEIYRLQTRPKSACEMCCDRSFRFAPLCRWATQTQSLRTPIAMTDVVRTCALHSVTAAATLTTRRDSRSEFPETNYYRQPSCNSMQPNPMLLALCRTAPLQLEYEACDAMQVQSAFASAMDPNCGSAQLGVEVNCRRRRPSRKKGYA